MKQTLTCLFAALLAACAYAGASAQSAGAQPQQQARQQQTPEAAEVVRLTREVGELYQAGKFEEALPLAERVVALSEKASPADSRATATAYANLAAIHAGLENFDRARAAYERALPVLEREVGTDDPATNRVRENLASTFFRRGEYAKAEPLLALTLASRERTLGPHHDETMRALASLAFLHLASGEHEKRDATYVRLIDAAEKSPNKLSEEVRTVLARYSCVGASHPDARPSVKAIGKRIEEMWEARRASDKQGDTLARGVINGLALSKPAPAYPMEAKQRRVQGVVVVQITVNEEGRVVEARPLCGPRELQGASAQAARQARFTPTLKDGQPVKVTGTITYNFVLR